MGHPDWRHWPALPVEKLARGCDVARWQLGVRQGRALPLGKRWSVDDPRAGSSPGRSPRPCCLPADATIFLRGASATTHYLLYLPSNATGLGVNFTMLAPPVRKEGLACRFCAHHATFLSVRMPATCDGSCGPPQSLRVDAWRCSCVAASMLHALNHLAPMGPFSPGSRQAVSCPGLAQQRRQRRRGCS